MKGYVHIFTGKNEYAPSKEDDIGIDMASTGTDSVTDGKRGE